MNRLTQEEQDKIISLKREGYSSREIAQIVLGRDSRKSTVNDFLADVIVEETHGPRVLFIDIESSPEVSMHWRRFKENISQDQNILPSQLLGFAYRFSNEDSIHSVYPTKKSKGMYMESSECDEEVVRAAHDVLNQADIVVGHNVDGFDIPKLFTRMVYYGLNKPKPFKTIDTLKVARGVFGFPQNKLDVLGQYLKVGRKVEHEGFMLWRKCMEGDLDAWNRMEEYNVGDIVLLEEIYNRLVPWSPRIPNLSINYPNAIPRCPTCGGRHIHKHEGYAYTQVSMFDLYHCDDCGGWARGRRNLKLKEQRENILTTVR